MESIQTRILAANSLLAPYAVPLEGHLGREFADPEDDTRFPFQRDRDRIIHAQAFRRLQGKTQVFAAGENDYYRTRLTHTLEVAQISRDIARTLQLNEDLAEGIALAHDLGHPPFGHAGEEALNAYMAGHGRTFEHNHQSLRIVTYLEEHSALWKGLNLNRELLEGLQKHDHLPHGPTLEAQAADLADEIAYTAHDSDDGLRSGLFSIDDIKEVPLAAEAYQRATTRATSLRGALIQSLVTDLYAEADRLLVERRVAPTLDAVYIEEHRLLGFSAPMMEQLSTLKSFLWQRMYLHPRVQEANREGQEIVLTLCRRFETNPPDKILELQARTGDDLPEAVKDYVAGMTDGFARGQI